jgi:hypothetical protein
VSRRALRHQREAGVVRTVRRVAIESLGLVALSRADLVRIVSLWDPLKQRAGLNAFQWVVIHREQNMPLIERLAGFLESVGYRQPVAAAAAPPPPEAPADDPAQA